MAKKKAELTPAETTAAEVAASSVTLAEVKDAWPSPAPKGKGKPEAKGKTRDGEAKADSEAGKMSDKAYAKEMKKLHVELVKLQQWVVAKGLKVCIVFEGRDGAGKGGTIKAITERVSPRVFRVVALPGADRSREVADVRPALPATLAGGRRSRDLRPQLVQPCRRRARDGLLHRRTGPASFWRWCRCSSP